MKRIISVLLVLVLLLILTACGEEDGGKKKGTTREKNETTASVTPSGVVTPTAEPSGEPTPTAEPVGDPTPTAEPGPTEAPTPTPTLAPTPVAGYPVPDVYEGPRYVIAEGEGVGSDLNSMHYTGDGVAFDATPKYLYITEYGYPELATVIRQNNLEMNRRMKKFSESAAELLAETTYDFADEWYDVADMEVLRTDSKVFSYVVADESYLGGAHPYLSFSGYTYETKTGEPIDLATMITDLNGFTEDVIEYLEPESDKEGFWDNWEEKVRISIASGEVGWCATDDGLMIWFNNGFLAPYATGTVYFEYTVMDYPTRFNPELVGAYGDYEKQQEDHSGYVWEDTWDYSMSERDRYILRNLAEGVGSMTWAEAAAILDEYGVQHTGYSDEEAALTYGPVCLEYTALDSDEKFFAAFGKTDQNSADPSEMYYFYMHFPQYAFYLWVMEAPPGHVQYNVVDCSFEDDDLAYVYDLDDAMNILFVAMESYYTDITE